MHTHLKVWVLKRLDGRYTSFWVEREAFFQKVDCLRSFGIRCVHVARRLTSSLAPWNMVLKSFPFLNGRARMYSRDRGDEMA